MLRSLSEQLARLQVEVNQFAQLAHRVEVENFDMPFKSMVSFSFKIVFALFSVNIIFGVIGLCAFLAFMNFASSYFRL